MAYRIFYARPAQKDIEKLDALARKRLSNKIAQFLRSPLKYATKLANSEIGEYRWRVGNLRIIFDLDGDVVYVVRVRHRRDVYKRV